MCSHTVHVRGMLQLGSGAIFGGHNYFMLSCFMGRGVAVLSGERHESIGNGMAPTSWGAGSQSFRERPIVKRITFIFI